MWQALIGDADERSFMARSVEDAHAWLASLERS